MPLPPGEPGGLRADPATGAVWVWTASDPSGQATTLARIEPDGSAPAQTAAVVGPVLDAAAGDGALWLGTGAGVLGWRAGAAPVAVPGLDLARVPTAPAALAFDPGRHRLLVGLEDRRLVAVDVRSGRTTAEGTFGYGKGALALTGSGELWAGGYIGGGPTVARLDPQTLAVLGTSTVVAVNGPGAWVWPGERVVWVRNGGDTGLTCVAAGSGQPLQRWDSVQGPVASSWQDGAFAVHEGTLYRLPAAGGCAG